MDIHSQALRRFRTGHFLDSLHLLRRIPEPQRSRADLSLEAEALAFIGRFDEATALAERLMRRGSNDETQATCRFVLGMSSWYNNSNAKEAVAHFVKAIALASDHNDLYRLCWSQLLLLSVLADTEGSDSTIDLLSKLRINSVKLGEHVTTAAIHAFVAQNEAKVGARASAERHLSIARDLLVEPNDHPWLRAVACNVNAAISIMSANVEEGIDSALNGLALAKASGSERLQLTLLGNLGNLYCLGGQFEKAIDCFERCIELHSEIMERPAVELIDSLASVFLIQGKVDEAHAWLSKITEYSHTEADWYPYPQRHSRLTLAKVLIRKGFTEQAYQHVDFAINVAQRIGDKPLHFIGLLLRSELAGLDSHQDEAVSALREAMEIAPRNALAFAQSEHQVARLFQMMGSAVHCQHHMSRAERLYASLRHRLGLSELGVGTLGDHSLEHETRAASESSPNEILQEVTAIFTQTDRGELVASGLLAILSRANCVVQATAVAVEHDGSERLIGSYQDSSASPRSSPTIKLTVDSSQQPREIALYLHPRDDLESIATLNAVRLLLDTAKELETARREREERMTLWPIDDVPLDGGDAIINGRMRDVMAFARRVASTTACVLITGESGTGKEILARAIHHYSPRSTRPFIPFNCTAVPRDMLESQMFGHRRGAFTGADRDYPGLIRTARDGTLFLDEVGELGLDLQPKLLRFLESGEISPLGEPGPLTVNVRIVAATNRNLEDLVQEGRFREDLFYRLNVIRLTIPPLRERRDEIPALVQHFVLRAATEFDKGRVRIAEETMEHLLLHAWPGNVRELNNEIRRMVALAETDAVLDPNALSPGIRKAAVAARHAQNEFAVALDDKLGPTIARLEREMIRTALRANHGKVEAAAQALGISRKGLYLKRQRLGL